MQGIIQIGGAFALGAVVIAGAVWYDMTRTQAVPQEQAGALAVAQTSNNRPYIPVTDSDGDGVSDWQEQFQNDVFGRITSIGSTTISSTTRDTFTGQFARQFFEGFMRQNAGEQPSEEKQRELLNGALSSLNSAIESKVYTTDDLVIGEGSDFALREYGNAIAAPTFEHTPEDPQHEILILMEAVDGNEENLKDLAPIKESYRRILEDTLSTPVPPQLADEHATLVSSYHALYEDISAFEKMYDDPLLALVHGERYQENALLMYEALQSIYKQLYDRGIRYGDDEPAGRLDMYQGSQT